MNKWFLFLLTIFLLCLPPSAAYADPSEISSYLLRTPVNWMTQGINQINQLFNRDGGTYSGYSPSAYYDFSADRIVIRLLPTMLFDSDITNKDKADKLCKRAISEVKTRLLANREGGPASFKKYPSLVPSFFAPEGWTDERRPKDFEGKIDSITKLTMTVNISSDKKEQKTPYLQCVSALTEAEVFTSEGTFYK